MKTMLALLFLSQPAHAICLPCYLPQPPQPCVPHLDGSLARARAEHLRCVLMDNDAMRFYIRSVELALARCQQK